jgi:hypothetical protein
MGKKKGEQDGEEERRAGWGRRKKGEQEGEERREVRKIKKRKDRGVEGNGGSSENEERRQEMEWSKSDEVLLSFINRYYG